MFGYVLPDCETLSVREYSLYRAIYCGICLATKRRYGQLPRMTVNYDITTFALLATEAESANLEFGMCRCLGDFRRKPYVKSCDLIDRMADLNILLCAHKAEDDAVDSGRKSFFTQKLLRPHYEKARQRLPEADKIMEEMYSALREAEKAGESSLDRSSDHFAKMLERTMATVSLSCRDEYYSAAMRKLCYNIGKFVYLADALDDLEEDFAKKRYNPIIAFAPDYEKGGRKEYLERHMAELRFAVNSTINRAIASSNELVFTQANDLLRNIIYEGLRKKADELFSAEKKLPAPKVRLPKSTVKEFRKTLKAQKAIKRNKKE